MDWLFEIHVTNVGFKLHYDRNFIQIILFVI